MAAPSRRKSLCSSLVQQREEIAPLLKTELREGESWYLISTKWLSAWKKYVGFDDHGRTGFGGYPGCIDNSPILREDGKLKKNIVEELDFVAVPSAAWDRLSAWYGVTVNQQPLERKIIKQGVFSKTFKVELYLMDFYLGLLSQPGKGMKDEFSRTDKIGYIHWKVRKMYKIDSNKETRLWNKFMSNTYEQLRDQDATLHEASLYQGQVILIEERTPSGGWTRKEKSGGYTESCLLKYKRDETVHTDKLANVVDGLQGDFTTFLQVKQSQYQKEEDMLTANFQRFVDQAKLRFEEEERSLAERDEELRDRDKTLRGLESDFRKKSDNLECEWKKLNDDKAEFAQKVKEKDEQYRKERREFREECRKREKELTARKDVVDKMAEELDIEKKNMEEINRIQKSRITLDVGGSLFKTSITTLLKDSESMLAVMFSGRHPLKTEDDGSYFIDRDGTHFRLILNYLREGEVKEGTLPEDVQTLKEIKNEAEYYQLNALMKTVEDMITQLP
ncbi:uncharacterized protein LOC100377510 [Saccoglossus kowalevskii]|uniref:Interaptin-like n=1 Tax=Saccoglossus kowalevskii TaxID=10224 RepID=A0ABM0M0G3_SACKO|nr:PREDICTED: interaptin-like [Saccoglossus kowalevskii]